MINIPPKRENNMDNELYIIIHENRDA